ncbi:MAG: OB-fold protein, partial [Chthoniobacteraceae bacterium]
EPRTLRALQQQMIAKQQELITTVVKEALPRLIEHKRALTVAGKLDEAIAVRSGIERLQNSHLPLVRPEPGTIIPAESLLQIYSANRTRADQVYKGQRITMRGVLGGIRPDAADSGRVAVYVSSPSGGGWVECTFQAPEYQVREEKQFNATFIVFTPKGNNPPVRMQKGQTIEVRGVCEGWDELVRLSKSELAR